MLPLNLLLLPLIGGFVFVSRWHVSRFVVLRAEGYRLLFHSAVAGLTLLFLSALVGFAATNAPSRLEFLGRVTKLIIAGWATVVPVPHSGTAVFALLLGCSLWIPLNRLAMNRRHQIDVVIARKEDSLEVLLRRALGQGQPVFLRLKSGVDYVGFITSNFNPVFQTEYIKILPLLLGHKDKSSDRPVFTRNLGPTYLSLQDSVAAITEDEFDLIWDEKTLQRLGEGAGISKYETVIPIKEIKVASIYIPELHDQAN